MKKTLLHRFIRSRPHLALAIAFGAVIALLLPESTVMMTRALVAWNAAVWSYLGAMMWIIVRADHRKVRSIAEQQDESAAMVLVALVVASVFSLSALFFELSALADAPTGQRAGRYVLTVLTLFGSWLLVGMLFCFHYAHLYYRGGARRAPLKFPDDEQEPDYWDFLYFSFTISVAVQTSDVAIMTRAMRKLVLGHSVLNFFFNLVILGLSINIAAGLIKS
ncbi:MAG: DUF1345 domain-containing protein [Massilia sp.]|nr:DUF1345 domain-containing protein [Massilia sp.]